MANKQKTKVFHLKEDIRSFVKSLIQQGKVVGLVPTMGCFHKGHLSLMHESLKETDATVVSIFVNPTQFGPNEDFDKYPRTIEKDIQDCEELGISAIFAPTEDEMYSEGKENIYKIIPPEKYTNKLCGEFRPGHFEGVSTIVTKLFNIIPANKAFFGQKDAQQLFIIRKMVQSLDMPIEIVACPTMREPDGLACSSRNLNLDPPSRKLATNLYQSLSFIKSSYLAGEDDFSQLYAKVEEQFLNQSDQILLEYLVALDYNNFKLTSQLRSDVLIAIAAKIGGVRLIDNIIID